MGFNILKFGVLHNIGEDEGKHTDHNLKDQSLSTSRAWKAIEEYYTHLSRHWIRIAPIKPLTSLSQDHGQQSAPNLEIDLPTMIYRCD